MPDGFDPMTNARKLLITIFVSSLFMFYGTLIADAVGKGKGEKLVSLSYVNADLVYVLKNLSARMGINIVLDREVRGNVTLELNNVPALSALNLILKMHGYDYKVLDGTIVVGTEKALEKIPPNIMSTSTKCWITRPFPLQYADPAQLAGLLEKVFPDAKYQADSRSCSLIVTADPDTIERIRVLIYGPGENEAAPSQ